jgi:D-alanine-D-alanine ligase
MKKIGLVYDLRKDYLAAGFSEEDTAEFDSEETINFLEAAIISLGYETERIGNGRALASALESGRRWDMVFNIAEGVGGRCREAYVPALLEMYGVPYTFSDPLVCALTLDKAMAKIVVAQASLATPDFKVVRNYDDILAVDMPYPLFAKPLAEGTGKGIDQNSTVDDFSMLESVCCDLLHRCRQPVLVEQYLPGREFTVGILGSGSSASVIGTMEIDVLCRDEPAVYSFINKEECESRIVYSRLEEPLLKAEVEKLALDCYNVLQCRDSGRVDIRCDVFGRPCFIEVNPLAGLHPTHSDLCMIAANEGMSYRDLIGAIVSNAFARYDMVAEELCRAS